MQPSAYLPSRTSPLSRSIYRQDLVELGPWAFLLSHSTPHFNCISPQSRTVGNRRKYLRSSLSFQQRTRAMYVLVVSVYEKNS